MSETRRQLFKTSILSALGLISASGLTACGTERSFDLRRRLGDSDPTVPLVGKATDGHWYVFKYNSFDPDKRNYTYDVWRASENPPSEKPLTGGVRFDTGDWHKELTASSKLIAASAKFTIGSTTYNPTNGSITGGPVNGFAQAPQIPCVWNEIGHL